MTTTSGHAYQAVSEDEYRRRINAWTMYDWANSAFATTILAAVLPVYYSQVAGATLPSAAMATAYWSTGLSISLLIVAIISPILGTISDVMRGKKRFLSFFVSIGVLGTGLLILVKTGDWLLASILFVLGRIGFTAANVFYDALLPHVAREEDQDRVSTRGYAMGYLGGGLLLAINVVMIQMLPGTWGPRLSFLSVAIWWAIFSIPIFLRVPEPPAAEGKLEHGKGLFANMIEVTSLSFSRLRDTFRDIRQYRELFKYLLAFLIYNDGIGTIIGVAAIYGAELGFGSVELILALLLVQFVGIPFSLIFGSLPSPNEKRRPLFLAFICFNLIALPLVGIAGKQFLSTDVSGALPPPYTDTTTSFGEGTYSVTDEALSFVGAWQQVPIPADELGTDDDVLYAQSSAPNAELSVAFNGQEVELTYSIGPEGGIWIAELDDQPFLDADSGEQVEIDSYQETIRYSVTKTFEAEAPGEHILTLINTGRSNPASQGTQMSVAQAVVLPPIRQSNLILIIGLVLGVELVGLAIAVITAKPLFHGLANAMDTKTSIVLALIVYAVIAVWGYFLNSVIEFWFLAWMVAIVQGGSQALSRSLYASMSPSIKSGEFFGLFGIMEKFSAIIGPLVFAAAAATFGSSRPAVLSLIAFFIIGGYLLITVNVDEGRRVARKEDAALL
jgi:UMF1 family MFS transporter